MAVGGLSKSILLELSAVGREFRSGDGTFAALKDIDLRIGDAEMVAVIGASGSGKSTLMNILGCLDRPTSGTYRIGGMDVASLDADGFSALRRERFGFIFQRYNLLPDLTALENVEVPAVYLGLPRVERHNRAASLLGRLELQERLDHRPSQLSGGQQQRVSIARALMNGGGIILADEPTGALDSRVGEEVLSVLRQLHAEGHTVILVTHDPNVAAHADRVIEIKDGRIVSDRRKAAAPQPIPVSVEKPRHVTGFRKGATVVSDIWGRLAEALRMAVLAMNANRLRTFLTMLGIIIGIASVASVVALGQGGQQRILSMIRGIGTNTIDIYPGSGWGDLKAASVETLTPYDADSISRQGHIDSVTPTVTTTASVRFSGQSVSGTINGVGADFFRVHNMQIAEGKLFSPADVAALSQVVVIDENTRNKLFPITEIPVGHVVFLGPVPFRVVGIAKPAAGVFPDPNLNVWAPYTAVMGRISGQRHLKGITARFSDDSPSAVVETLITRLLLLRHGRHDFYMNNTDTIRISVQAATDTMTHVVLSIALVSLVVGGIGVMNIMLVSVTERTREIGIRMAVGARRLDILWQFVIEAVLVCIIGGLLGVVLAFATSFVLPRFFPTYPMIFSVGSVVAAVTVSTLTGVLFGFIPARNAARLDPVEALARD